jgi:hypothetical protein
MGKDMEANSAKTHFTKAMVELATGTGSIQERLSSAWLVLMALTKDDLPLAFQEAFGLIEAEMLSSPEDPETLSDTAASESAERILLLAVELWRSPD